MTMQPRTSLVSRLALRRMPAAAGSDDRSGKIGTGFRQDGLT
jgi:hypothetical protein